MNAALVTVSPYELADICEPSSSAILNLLGSYISFSSSSTDLLELQVEGLNGYLN